MRELFGCAASQSQEYGVAAFIRDAGFASVGIDRVTRFIKIFRADVKWLMNIGDIMCQQDDRDRFGDLARIILRRLTLEDAGAESDHVHHIPLTAASLAIR